MNLAIAVLIDLIAAFGVLFGIICLFQKKIRLGLVSIFLGVVAFTAGKLFVVYMLGGRALKLSGISAGEFFLDVPCDVRLSSGKSSCKKDARDRPIPHAVSAGFVFGGPDTASGMRLERVAAAGGPERGQG